MVIRPTDAPRSAFCRVSLWLLLVVCISADAVGYFLFRAKSLKSAHWHYGMQALICMSDIFRHVVDFWFCLTGLFFRDMVKFVSAKDLQKGNFWELLKQDILRAGSPSCCHQ